MPLVDLQPGEVMGVSHKLPRGRSVVFRVEAKRAVNTYVVDHAGWESLRRRQEFESHGGQLRRLSHEVEVRLPRRSQWFFVVENPQEEPITLFYEVLY